MEGKIGIKRFADAAESATERLRTFSLFHQMRSRVYHVLLPRGHRRDVPAPLVLALHGLGGTGRAMDAMTKGQFGRAADERGWVVVFPEGEGGWNDGRIPVTDDDRRRARIDDLGFLDALIDRMREDDGIDPACVYAAGISSGGFMCFRLAIDLSDRIAAVAAVAANLRPGLDDVRPRAPAGVLVMNGTADPIVPFAGGQVSLFRRERGEVLSSEATVRWFVERLGCGGREPERREIPPAGEGGLRTEVLTWTGCRGDVEVAFYRIIGGGHGWPGGRQYLAERLIGPVCRDFEAVPEIFDFFVRHRKASSGRL